MKDISISLRNYEEFIKIKDSKRSFYGGDQQWFESEKYKKAGCGAVVCANITAFLATEKNITNLYPYENFHKNNFIKHMNESGKFVIPEEGVGILKPKTLMKDVESFALSKGVNLKGKIKYFDEGYNSICSFIKDALKDNNPIALLLHRNEKVKEFDWHWMTITKYYENQFYSYINVSSWGERRILKLQTIYNFSSYGALVKFEN